jgi:hypothetical protein
MRKSHGLQRICGYSYMQLRWVARHVTREGVVDLEQPDPPLREQSILEVRIVRSRLRHGSVEEPEQMWDEVL